MLVIIDSVAEDGATTIIVDGERQTFSGEYSRVLAFHAGAAALVADEEDTEENP